MSCGPGRRCVQTTVPVAQACLELPFNCLLTGNCLVKGGLFMGGLECLVDRVRGELHLGAHGVVAQVAWLRLRARVAIKALRMAERGREG